MNLSFFTSCTPHIYSFLEEKSILKSWNYFISQLTLRYFLFNGSGLASSSDFLCLFVGSSSKADLFRGLLREGIFFGLISVNYNNIRHDESNNFEDEKNLHVVYILVLYVGPRLRGANRPFRLKHALSILSKQSPSQTILGR